MMMMMTMMKLRCTTLYYDVLGFITMDYDVLRCITMDYDVLRCITCIAAGLLEVASSSPDWAPPHESQKRVKVIASVKGQFKKQCTDCCFYVFEYARIRGRRIGGASANGDGAIGEPKVLHIAGNMHVRATARRRESSLVAKVW